MLAFNILNLFLSIKCADKTILQLKTGKKFGAVGDISIAVKNVIKHTDLGKKNMDKAGYLQVLNFEYNDAANVQHVFKSINCQQIFYIKKGSVFYRDNTSYVLTADKPLKVTHMECNVEMKNMKEVLIGRTRAPAAGAVVNFLVAGAAAGAIEPVRHSAVLCARAQTSFSFTVDDNKITEMNDSQFMGQLEYFTKDPNANNLVVKNLDFPAPAAAGGPVPSKQAFFGADANRNVFFLSEEYLTNMDVGKNKDLFEFEVLVELTNSDNVRASLEEDGYLMIKSKWDKLMAADKSADKDQANKKIKQLVGKFKRANKKPLTSSEQDSDLLDTEEEESKPQPQPAPQPKTKVVVLKPKERKKEHKKEHKKAVEKAPKKATKKEESINWTLWGIVIGIGSVIVILMIFAGVMIANRK
ncbi:hypothetical protein EHP00_2290 [Ecytonucleospora hepatopenaei]|uniref:Uncharacterized protein n=1 Tax=Ecytonucleospora hepatopenaei TaxID=646526 RepID=A0A1W0E3M7_9MICR|nr:hypothetical protein EHP00_2290 [Ecytonucleospora hepatopenaei]